MTYTTGREYLSVLYPYSVNYRDTNGDWAAIDNQLVPSATTGYAYANKANRYRLDLPSDLSGAPVRIALGDQWLSFSLVGGSGSASVSGATATYERALQGVAVAYRAEYDQVKETTTLASASAPSTFTYSLQTSAGLTPRTNSSGSVEFVDSSGRVAAAFAPPFMKDAAGTVSHAVSVRLAAAGSSWTMTVAASPAWLASGERRWPVVVDPSVVFYTTQLNTDVDCYISSGSADTPLCGGQSLDVGYSGASSSRSLLKFFVEQALPNNSQVLNAELRLYQQSASTTASTSVDLLQVNEDWSSLATWNHRDFSNTWSTPGGTIASGPSATTSVAPAAGWYSWYPTELVSKWLHRDITNTGLLLKQTGESTNQVLHFASAENVDASLRPRLVVRWQQWLGEQPWLTLDGRALTDSMSLKVNVANGNLAVAASDMHLAGTGLDLTIGRWFNSLSGITGDLGNNWLMTTGRDVGLTIFNDGSVAFYGPSGYQHVFFKNADGTYKTPPGANASLVKLGTGEYTLTFNGADTWKFSSAGRLLTQNDRNGNTITMNYDPSNGALASITDSKAGVTTISYDTGGYISQIVDPAGRRYQYSRAPGTGNLVDYVDPSGATTNYAYTNGRLSDITDSNNTTTSIDYDSQGRVLGITVVTNPAAGTGPVWTFQYATSDSRCPANTIMRTTVTNPDNKSTSYCSDARGRVAKTIDDLGRTTSTSYNDNNDVASTTNEAGGVSDATYSTDSRNNLVKVQGPANTGGQRQSSQQSYTDTNNPFSPTSYKDPQGKSWTYTYDVNGNTLAKAEGDAPGQRPVTFTYRSDGTVATITDAKNTGNSGCANTAVTICFGYDAATHNLTSINHPAPLGDDAFTYDALHRLKTHTDGKGQTTTYTHQGAVGSDLSHSTDRIARIDFAGGASISFAYDANGNLLSRTDSSGTTTYAYDKLNQLTDETKPDNSHISYAHSADGELQSITENGATTQYSYDAAGRLTAVQEPGPATIGISYPDEQHATISYPGGASVASTFDTAGRLLSIVNKNAAGSTVASYTYAYTYTDTGGQPQDGSLRASVADNLGNTTSYTYDTVGRLLRALTSGPNSSDYQYTYDNNGNTLSTTINGTTTNHTVNAVNQLNDSGYSYDANGNQTNSPTLGSITYNDKEQTTAIGSNNASYSGKGQFERLTFGSDSFLNDRLGVGRWTNGSASTDFSRDPSGRELGQRSGTNRYYYAFDGLGSVVGLFDSAGNLVSGYTARYEPYGKIVGSLPAGYPVFPIRFAGYWYDSQTGLYKVGARYYQPDNGRWTQRDPIDDPGALTGWNRYIYAGDDPINFTDPSGEWFWTLASVAASVAIYQFTTDDHSASGYLAAAVGGLTFRGSTLGRGLGVGNYRLALHGAHDAVPALRGGLLRKSRWIWRHHWARPHAHVELPRGRWNF